MRYTLLVLLTSLLFRADAVGQTRQNVERQTRDYYSQWIGVPAPEFSCPLRDRSDDGPELRLQDYKGKRLLLVAFDTGDFVDGPRNEKTLIQQLTVLHNLRQQYSTNVAVIGFTYGPMFFTPDINPPTAIKDLTDFPVVNNNKLRHAPLPEPYNLLQRWPSLLAIDKHGVVIGIYSPPLVESNMVHACAIDNWTNNVRLPPREVPSEVVTNWSCRNYWVVFAYAKDLNSGSKFQKGFGRMKRVYLADEVPVDEVSGLKTLEGMKLRRDVKAGDTIRKSDFGEQ
ncbi:MAG: SAF domain-containing protein [Verrucomicrobiota bacterium]|jgi:hypothetical protein